MAGISILATHPLTDLLGESLTTMLQGEGEFTIEDGSYAAARIDTALKQHTYDLILTRIDGLHSQQRIEHLVNYGHGQKVLIAGNYDAGTLFEYIRIGVKGFIAPDITSELLLRAFRVVTAGEVWFDRATSATVLQLFAGKQAQRQGHDKLDQLSRREMQVLECVAKGLKNRDIAGTLFISESTVKTHLYKIYEKLGVKDRLAAALMLRNRT